MKPRLEGDLSPYYFSIRGASAVCGISTSTLERASLQGTFPPKKRLSAKRVGVRAEHVEQWIFEDKRGEWI